MNERADPTAGAADPLAVEIVLNGETRRIPRGQTVLDLLAALERHPRTVAVELDGAIVPREGYGSASLETGARVEIVHFVQGG